MNNCGSSTLSIPAGGTILWSNGANTASITVTVAGTYTVTRTVDGCTSAAGSGVAAPKVLPTASIVYTGSPYCRSFFGLAFVTRSGQAGGTYSSTAGLLINSLTGTIYLFLSSAGTYTVTYSFSNGICSNTTMTTVRINNCNDDDRITNTNTNGVDPKTQALRVNTKLEITAYPNPTESYFNLKVKSTSAAEVQIKVFDISGKLLQVLKGSPDQTFRFGDRFIAGAYVVEVLQGEKQVTAKIIKQ